MISILCIGSITTVHPFATSWPSSPKGDARTLRDWLSVSYVTQYPVPPIFSFPLEGKSREAGKGVRGRAPIRCSIAVLTANRRPVSFGLLTLGHACSMRVPRVQRGAGRKVLMFKKAIKKELPKEFSFFILIRMRSSVRCPRCRRDLRCCRMLWLRSCSKRPVLRSSGVLRLRGLPRSERRTIYPSRNPAGR